MGAKTQGTCSRCGQKIEGWQKYFKTVLGRYHVKCPESELTTPSLRETPPYKGGER